MEQNNFTYPRQICILTVVETVYDKNNEKSEKTTNRVVIQSSKDATRFVKMTEKQCQNKGVVIEPNLPVIKKGVILGKNTEVMFVGEDTIQAKNITKKTNGRRFGIDSFVHQVIINNRNI